MWRRTVQAERQGVDPREWANAGLSNEELDFEAQRAALESWKGCSRMGALPE